MTAEQLEELLGKVTPDDEVGHWVPDLDDDCCFVKTADWELSLLTTSLARRVLAADKLVEALSDAVDAWDAHNKYGDMMQGYWVLDARSALTAYREAGK